MDWNLEDNAPGRLKERTRGSYGSINSDHFETYKSWPDSGDPAASRAYPDSKKSFAHTLIAGFLALSSTPKLRSGVSREARVFETIGADRTPRAVGVVAETSSLRGMA